MDEPSPGEGSNTNNAGGPGAADLGVDGHHDTASPAADPGGALKGLECGDADDTAESDAHRLGVTVDLPLEEDDIGFE